MATKFSDGDEKNLRGETDEPSLENEETAKRAIRFRMKNVFVSPKVYPIASSNLSLRKSCRESYSANSKLHRIWLTTKILGVSALAILGLFVFVILDLKKSLASMEMEKKVQEDVDFSVKVADVIHALQVERGLTVLSISSKGAKNITQLLNSSRVNTIDAINKLHEKHEEEHFSKTLLPKIQGHRDAIGYGENSTIKEEIKFYTDIIQESLQWLFTSLIENFPNTNTFELLGYQMFLAAKDNTGIERALGGSFFAMGHFNNTELLWFAEQQLIGEAFLNTSMKLMPKLKTLYDQILATKKFENITEKVNQKRSIVLENKPRSADTDAGSQWFSLMSVYIEMLLKVQKGAGEKLIGSLKERVNTEEKGAILRIAIMVIVLMLTPLLVLAVVRMTNTIQKYAAKLEDITLNLKEEQKRTDNVLSAMFPKSVAETLKKGEKVNSEYFDSVTVFFSDIVNFTNICACISPIEVTSMLNNIYSAFDDKIDKYDVYKVETIGDAYMVASGLPVRNGGKHVDEICRMALDLVKVTGSLKLVEVTGETLLIRVGIHTGPCVSGIVGNKMPRYCLFGDTVNTASRMQTTGERKIKEICLENQTEITYFVSDWNTISAQKIHVSEGSQKALRPFKHYVLEFRGYIEVKGKGEMQTYWLHDIDSVSVGACS